MDGDIAYTGGANIADEYANLIERFGYWKDCGLRLEGEGAWGLTREFLQMWQRMDGQLYHEYDYYRPLHHPLEQGFCQTVVDGPDDNPNNAAEDLFLQMIGRARREVYITTPYLAIDEPMLKALCLAADSGVDVRLIMPGIPDHKFAYLVAESYWGELMRHGVKIYKYTPGFIHAKSVLVDRKMALIGSTNMDYRSFQLHYEDAVMLYHMPVIEELLEDMDHIVEDSQLYTLEDWENRPWLRRMTASILKLGAIWL